MPEELEFEFKFSNSFANRQESSPVFLRHRGLQGSVNVRHVADNEVEKVKVVLRGHMINVVGHGCPALYQPHKVVLEQKVLKLMDVQDSVSSRYNPDNGEGETFHFDFPLSKEPWGPDDSSDDEDESITRWPRTLPSSLNVFGPWCANAAGQACCQAEVIVRYELEAAAYHGDEVVSRATKEVRIYDSPKSHPPPVHLAHFPDEYNCTAERRLKTMGIPGLRMSVTVTEPKPVEVKPYGEATMAAFPLRFTVRSSNQSSPPGKLDVRVNSLLKATTFIAVRPMKSQPTTEQSRKSPFLAAVPKYGRSYHRKLRLCHWTRGPASSESSWVANALVWLPITENTSPSPTFFTNYLSRRYSVALRLDVKGDGKGLFNLQVPLQIVYPMELGSNDAPSYEAAITPPNEEENPLDAVEESLPLYVR